MTLMRKEGRGMTVEVEKSRSAIQFSVANK